MQTPLLHLIIAHLKRSSLIEPCNQSTAHPSKIHQISIDHHIFGTEKKQHILNLDQQILKCQNLSKMLHPNILHEVTINIVSQLFTLGHSLKIILYLITLCVFRIWIADFVLTITLVPQHRQSPFTTHFKATHIGINMNAVSVSQSITVR